MFRKGRNSQGSLGSIHGLAVLGLVNFAIIGIRNLALSKLLGPNGYGVNSLSSQILSFLAFLDLGAVALLQREVPRNSDDKSRIEEVLTDIRRITIRSYLVSTVGLVVVFILLNLLDDPQWNIAIIAALIIFPVQNTMVFKMAVLNATHQQSRALKVLTSSSLINFILTFILYSWLGIWIILVAPCLGFLFSQLLFKNSIPNLPLWKIIRNRKKYRKREIFFGIKSIFGSNLAAYALQNIDFYVALFSQSQKSIGFLGFALNLLTLVPVLPIIISNKMSPILNDKSGHYSMLSKLKLIRNMRDSVSYAVGFATFFAAGFGTLLVTYSFTNYTSALSIIWIFGISFSIYTSTFYTSTFALLIDRQSEILRIQLTSVLAQSSILLMVVIFYHIDLNMIAYLSVVRSIIYFELMRQFVKEHLSNSSEILHLFRLKIGIYLVPLISCELLVVEGSRYLMSIALGLGLLYYLIQFRNKWITFNRTFSEVAI